MITAEIKMGEDYTTNVSGNTISEVLGKIISFHTMDDREREHYSKKGKLEKEISTGWYIVEDTK
jgi:hypothetical protein